MWTEKNRFGLVGPQLGTNARLDVKVSLLLNIILLNVITLNNFKSDNINRLITKIAEKNKLLLLLQAVSSNLN